MRTILLLEDDENLNRGIVLKLQKEGYQVFSAFQISEAGRFEIRAKSLYCFSRQWIRKLIW